jgi:hypothetical protein
MSSLVFHPGDLPQLAWPFSTNAVTSLAYDTVCLNVQMEQALGEADAADRASRSTAAFWHAAASLPSADDVGAGAVARDGLGRTQLQALFPTCFLLLLENSTVVAARRCVAREGRSV